MVCPSLTRTPFPFAPSSTTSSSSDLSIPRRARSCSLGDMFTTGCSNTRGCRLERRTFSGGVSAEDDLEGGLAAGGGGGGPDDVLDDCVDVVAVDDDGDGGCDFRDDRDDR